MTADPTALVGVGGALGAVLRYAVQSRLPSETFPTGTLAVNVIGSFVLTLVTVAGSGDTTVLLVGVGACGAFTTFSSFSFETVRLVETGHRWQATAYAAGSLVCSLVAAGLAWLLVAA